jgi:hypothetical protein
MNPDRYDPKQDVVWVSEYASVAQGQFSNFSLREQVNFQWADDEIRFALDQNA